MVVGEARSASWRAARGERETRGRGSRSLLALCCSTHFPAGAEIGLVGLHLGHCSVVADSLLRAQREGSTQCCHARGKLGAGAA
jgi:hypothetical protein